MAVCRESLLHFSKHMRLIQANTNKLNRIIELFQRDGIMYFGCILVANITNVIIFLVNPLSSLSFTYKILTIFVLGRLLLQT